MESKKTVLYDRHASLGASSHMADFAGYMMPLWYSSISTEHSAVRQAAGLFDCTHMGVFSFEGKDAAPFLNIVSTNNIDSIDDGQAQYSYVLNQAGEILDDIIIYKFNHKRFMVVVNAGNEPKMKDWFNTVVGSAMVNNLSPSITDLRDTSAGENMRIDIALQGPASVETISSLCRDDISAIKPFRFITTEVAGIDVILSRTGYTGAKTGFELYAHPDKTVELWDAILKAGEKLSVVPCGLGARDSLRIEAGLPLYGHELAGEFNISPFEAGYGWAVKLDKDEFIGKTPMVQNAENYQNQVVRLQFPGERGIRPLRHNDAVLTDEGVCIGWILSCAKIGDKQIALAYVKRDSLTEQRAVGAYYLAKSQAQKNKGKKDAVSAGEIVESDIKGITLSRFERF